MASGITIAKMFILFRAQWPERAVDESTVQVYEHCLADLDPCVLEAAVLKCLTECTFYPRIAEIRAKAADLMYQALSLPTPYEAWALVHERTKPGHSKDWRNWPSELTRALEGIGGYEAFAMSDMTQEVSWRARFFASYEAICRTRRDNLIALPAVRQEVRRLATAPALLGAAE